MVQINGVGMEMAILEDIAIAEYIENDRRPRPYPYDVTSNLTLTDGLAPNTFAAWALLIPKTTYDFGDDINRIQVHNFILNLASVVDEYIVEFASSPDGVAFSIIGGFRFIRLGAATRSATYSHPCRPFNIDDDGLYGRIKSAIGGNNVQFSLGVKRYLEVSNEVDESTGVWPTG